MNWIRRFVTMAVCVLVLDAIAASAQSSRTAMMNDLQPFSKTVLSNAMAEGKVTLVFFHAPWCPVCQAQEPKIKAHLAGDYKHVTAFKVDYDSNQALRKEMNVDRQSTLILFRGKKELARLSYTSEDAVLKEFFSHAKMM